MNIRKSALNYFRRLSFRQHQAKLARNSAGCSRANEAQILKQLIADLLPPDHHRTAVDIGAGDGIRWSNTYDLFSEGWRGVGVEGDSRKVIKLARAYRYYPNVSACRARVTPHTIAPLLRAYEIEKNFSVLSLDIDGNDYWVLRAILSEFRPCLIVTEINEKIPPPVRFIVKYNPNFELRHHFFGYSIASLADLCDEFGYRIVSLEYNNAFLATNELPGAKGVDAETAYRQGYRDRPDRKEKFATNFDMDWIQSLSPEEAIKSLQAFYAKYPDEYYLSLGRIDARA